jgi:hypothetical protein
VTKYLVGDEHTLVYQQEGSNMLGVLHGSILRGSPYGGPLQGMLLPAQFKVLREATIEDFKTYRVCPPKDFPGAEQMRWKVETKFAYGWENVWTEDDAPLTFVTQEVAERALDEYLADRKKAGMDSNRSDYRVVGPEGA